MTKWGSNWLAVSSVCAKQPNYSYKSFKARQGPPWFIKAIMYNHVSGKVKGGRESGIYIKLQAPLMYVQGQESTL